MLRAVVLIVVFVALLCGAALVPSFKDVLALGGIVGACVGLNWLTEKHQT